MFSWKVDRTVSRAALQKFNNLISLLALRDNIKKTCSAVI